MSKQPTKTIPPDALAVADAFMHRLSGGGSFPTLSSINGKARLKVLTAVLIARAIDRNTEALKEIAAAIRGDMTAAQKQRLKELGLVSD